MHGEPREVEEQWSAPSSPESPPRKDSSSEEEDYRILDIVCGHGLCGGNQAFLEKNGLVLKPLQSRGRGRREREFYELVWRESSALKKDDETAELDWPRQSWSSSMASVDAGLSPESSKRDSCAVGVEELRKHVPRYYGAYSVGEQDYIQLENLTEHFSKPSLIDIKVGARTWGIGASEKKVCNQLRKFPHQAEVGFRYAGIKVCSLNSIKYDYFAEEGVAQVFSSEEHAYTSLGKEFTKGLSPEDVSTGLEIFFSDGGVFQQKTARVVRDRLCSLRSSLAMQNVYWLFCSSILIIRESDQEEEGWEEKVSVKIIDFAHSLPTVSPAFKDEVPISGTDESSCCSIEAQRWLEVLGNYHWDEPVVDGVDKNFLFGVDRLIHQLETLLV